MQIGSQDSAPMQTHNAPSSYALTVVHEKVVAQVQDRITSVMKKWMPDSVHILNTRLAFHAQYVPESLGERGHTESDHTEDISRGTLRDVLGRLKNLFAQASACDEQAILEVVHGMGISDGSLHGSLQKNSREQARTVSLLMEGNPQPQSSEFHRRASTVDMTRPVSRTGNRPPFTQSTWSDTLSERPGRLRIPQRNPCRQSFRTVAARWLVAD